MNRFKNLLLISLFAIGANAQSIDKVEAIIGDEIVLTSEVESQYLQYLSQGNSKSDAIKCEIIEDLLFQKLLVNQAKLDSVVVTDEEVGTEIIKRLTYFESQLGSVEKVEEYFGKLKVEIELELGKVIKDQFLAERVQRGISSDVKVTPAEVREFFNQQNDIDIPIIPTKVEVAQIIVKPEISELQKDVDQHPNGKKLLFNAKDLEYTISNLAVEQLYLLKLGL